MSLMENEIGILEHPELTPRDRLQKQMQLAEELYKTTVDGNVDIHDLQKRNEMMEAWTSAEKNYSEAFRKIEEDPGFKIHPRLQGNPLGITLEDVEYYLEHAALPEA